MFEENTRPVLRCPECNKPFDKQATLKRHGYYCRSRKVGISARSRSCIGCAKAKTRCDNKRPKCSRCATKASECQYPVASSATVVARSKPDGSQTHDGYAASTPRRATVAVSDAEARPENRSVATIAGSDALVDDALDLFDPELSGFGEGYLDWNSPDFSFAMPLSVQLNQDSGDIPSSLDQISELRTSQAISRASYALAPLAPSLSTYAVRSIIRRSEPGTRPRRISNLMLHSLKAFPQMMLRRDTFPPFIHPRLVTPRMEDTNMEPLANCISLVYMINNQSHESRKLFWKNVRLECERFRQAYLEMNKWELLAAMQALCIYIIMRLDEGETEYNDFDFLIISAVVVVAKQFKQISHIDGVMQSPPSENSLEKNWENWIFAESARRLCVIYRVFNLLAYFEPAAMCDTRPDLIFAPLPAMKQLWEASDESAWKTESDRQPEVQTAFGLAVNGDLVKLEEGQQLCLDAVPHHHHHPPAPLQTETSSDRTAKWEEWCSGMDGFGGIVMLAASLAE